MTDKYNDDYREEIPEEEKTETNVSETQDNEKNNGNTQVADTAKETFHRKKVRGQKGQQRIRRCLLYLPQTGEQSRQNVQAAQPISASAMIDMHKTMETVSQFDYQGMLNNPNDFNQF